MTRKHDGMDERAVSPVIGVILMVAITVILAAVIGAFVLDLGQSQSENINAGVSFDESGTAVTVQLTDAGNAEKVQIKGCGTPPSPTSPDRNLTSVGGTVDLTCSGSGTITAIGYKGGDSSVIQNYDYGG